MISPNALTTLYKVKLLLGINNTSQDDLLDELINYASSFIEGTCNRKFVSAEYEEIFDAPNGNKLFLANYPVTDFTSFKYRNSVISNPTWLDFNANDYTVYDKEGYIEFMYANFAGMISRQKAFKAEYTAGYLVDWNNEFDATKHTLPNDITMLCGQLVSMLYNLRNSSGLASESTEGQSITYQSPQSLSTQQLTESQRMILSGYTKIRLT
jgi:hypothetical protein